MKKFELTPEQNNALEGYYLISTDTMIPMNTSKETTLTAENFRALFVGHGNELYELTVDDFNYYNPSVGDYDFQFINESNFVRRDFAPEKVVELLDIVIKERVIQQ